jgi:hypothetical protein
MSFININVSFFRVRQLKVIQMSDTSKYVPLKDPSTGGILVMRYASDQPEELVEPVAGTWPSIYFSSFTKCLLFILFVDVLSY